MRNRRYLQISIIVLIMCAWQGYVYAAEVKKPMIYMEKGDKIIMVQELGFAPSTPISDVLRLLPEMLSRSSDDVFKNYAVSFDDQDVDNLKYVVLMQTTVSEILKIEISEDATASYASNGATGKINLVPVPTREGLSGNVVGDVSTETDVQGSANVYWQKDQLEVRGSAHIESYKVVDYTTSEEWRANQILFLGDETTSQRSLAENVHMYLKYFITPDDRIRVRLWQSYGRDFRSSSVEYLDDITHLGEESSMFQQDDKLDTAKALVAFAYADYCHFFTPTRKLSFETSYKYNGKMQSEQARAFLLTTQQNYFTYTNQRVYPHAYYAKLYYDDLYKFGEDHSIKLKVGTQFNYDASNTNQVDSASETSTYTISESSLRHMLVSPYTDITYFYSHWLTMTLSGRYRYDVYQSPLTGQASNYHSYLARLMVDVYPAQGHAIRVSGGRNFLVPTLNSETGYSLNGDVLYMYDGSVGEHHFNGELGGQYSRVNLVANNQKNDVLSLRAAFRWNYRWLGLSLACNVFDNETYRQQLDANKYTAYYNISFIPLFRLPRDWQITLQLLYNSKVVTPTSEYAAYVLANARVSKVVGKWSFHLEWNDPIHYITTDKLYNPSTGISTFTKGNLYRNYVLFGVNYTI